MPGVYDEETIEVDNEEIKGRFYEEIEDIRNEEIRDYVEEVSDNAPEEFWSSPASSSGKYHPPEDNIKGGLVIHSIKCKRFAEKLATYELEHERFDKEDKDIVIAGSLLHDIKQVEENDKGDEGHGHLGYEFLDGFELNEEYKDKIKNCVRYHMGKWSEKDPQAEEVRNPSKTVKIVQHADYLASRKDISVVPDAEVSEEQIEEFC